MSNAGSQAGGDWLDPLFAGIRATARWVFFVFATLWAAGATYVDGPLGMLTGNAWLALGWLLIAIGLLVFPRSSRMRFLLWFAWFLVILVPWLGKAPSNDREWKPEWAKTGWVDLKGAELSFHNFRNFDYAPEGIATERWETRTVSLRNLKGMDYFHDAFGGDLIAHPIISFDFGPDGRIALSVETRRELGEDYSEIGGLYKMFELQYLWGDERDFIRVRTNIRNEPVYLYRTRFTPEQTLFLLLDSIRETNQLRERPRFYNVISANCTTSLQAQTLEFRETPFDIRMLANGRLDELIYEMGGFRGDELPFDEMRKRAFINRQADAAHDDPAFPERIRDGRPGFEDGSP
jgi:hypothetical protein